MLRHTTLIALLFTWIVTPAFSQLVCLPAPRLLTIMPMGGQAGSTFEVDLTGENIENVSEMIFSSPGITAKPVSGKENRFTVTIAPDTPEGIYDARIVSRLGISSARCFTVSQLEEVTQSEKNETLEKAAQLPLNSVCNAVMTARSIDFYSFSAKPDQRLVVECAAEGIDSKLTPVVIIADDKGRDLLVNRTGGIIDFVPPYEGTYHIKVNDLTYQGSDRHFYRLVVREVPGDDSPAPRHPATARVSSMSWPPAGLPAEAPLEEAEPNNGVERPHQVTLPLDIAGSFYPAADVDTFEFTAKKGETWWIEVASERLGRPTDPFVLVQKVTEKDGVESVEDVAELYDIKPPIKVSSNGYSYDGPPYDAGSPDVHGKLEIKEDGVYRLHIRDLFGGTRNDPENVYRLVVRKAAPDFALAAWAVHMTLRNGDRAAFSKPMALRAGGAKVIEVVAFRRDGFDGDIELNMEGLPEGVTATGLKIPQGKTVGHVILTAAADAESAFSLASLSGSATINESTVTRPGRIGSMEWPVKDARQEIPVPRLVGNLPVSVTDSEKASLSLSASEDRVWEATVGEKLTIPLAATWREEFSGTSVKFKTYGAGFEKNKEFEIPLKSETHEAEIDLAALKVKPGDYTIAFYGGAVTKYRYNPDAVPELEAEKARAEKEAAALAGEAKKLTDAAAAAPEEKKAELETTAKAAADKQKAAAAAVTDADKKLKAATRAATPKDIVDIVVSRPIRISVREATVETAAVPSK